MSRVYDAMRRAAAEQNAGAVAVDERIATADALDFASETFPAEPGASATATPVDVVAAIAPESPATTTADPGAGDPASTVDLLEVAEAPAVVAEAPAVVAEAPAVVAEAKPQPFDRIATRYEGKTVLDANISSQSREQYRRLAAALHRGQAVHGTKVIMVTSALMGEGKTLTASNVALTLSQSYQKQVLLIDADLRRPSLQAVFGIQAASGLSEGLTATDERPVQIHQISPRLGILPAGRPTSDPIAALTSDRMQRLIEEARVAFDWVILDTPPVAMLTDASLVASMTDGALIVVKAGETPWDIVDRAVQAVGRDRILGVVLNHATTSARGTGYDADYYYYSAQAK